MAGSAFTFEDIDRHLSGADLSAFEAGGRYFVTAEQVRSNPAIALPKICPAYRLVRPILAAIAALVIVPPEWRSVVKTFVGVMDAVCPSAGKA